MKILHVYRDLYKNGGIPYQTRSLLNAQSQIGHKVTTVSYASSLGDQSSTLNHEIHSITLSRGFRGLGEFRGVLKKYNPEVVHITGLWIPIHQLWLLEIRRTDIPYIVSTHGNLSPWGMNVRFGDKSQLLSRIWAKKIWHRLCDIPLLKYAAGVHVHSLYEKDLVTAAGIPNVYIVPNGIEPDWVEAYKGGSRKLHTPITFLHLGRLDIYHKGLDIICDALQKLVHSGRAKNFKVIFAGPTVNNSRQVLEQVANQLGNGILEVRDPVQGKDKEDILRESDYFFNLYRYAGMAIAPSEAIAKGLPLLAAREGHFGDWAQDAGFGFQIPLNSESLCKVMESILNAPESEYQRRSENALHFSQTYTWHRVASDMSHAYQCLMV